MDFILRILWTPGRAMEYFKRKGKRKSNKKKRGRMGRNGDRKE